MRSFYGWVDSAACAGLFLCVCLCGWVGPVPKMLSRGFNVEAALSGGHQAVSVLCLGFGVRMGGGLSTRIKLWPRSSSSLRLDCSRVCRSWKAPYLFHTHTSSCLMSPLMHRVGDRSQYCIGSDYHLYRCKRPAHSNANQEDGTMFSKKQRKALLYEAPIGGAVRTLKVVSVTSATLTVFFLPAVCC